MSDYQERFFRARDGLKLHYRDYPGHPGRAAVLCLAGLTRNCRDFESLAKHITPRRRVITPDLRGRGRSDYDPLWLINYHVGSYVDDMRRLLAELRLDRVIVIGTSLGGLIGMMMARVRPSLLAGLVLNDVGPEVDPLGVERIRSYIGRVPPVNTWEEATALMRRLFGAAHPNLSDDGWARFTRATFREDAGGGLRVDADPMVGEAIRAIPADFLPPLWSTFAGLRDVPTLALRGELSDVLSVATFERMSREKPDLIRVDVPDCGHVPQLDEPISRAAIDRFLDDIPE
jgi:pimeloyl-ACP methyl ester carboxylesterase